jgi:cytidylate kinase
MIPALLTAKEVIMAGGKQIEQIIERQARFWEVRERLAQEGGEETERAIARGEGPWITISKEWGARGVDLAHILAEELDWQVFDREIVAAIAEQTRMREAVLSRLDEQAIGAFNDYVRQMLVPNDPGQLAYLQELAKVIWGLARQGNAIILGRGANWFLDSRHGLRMRVIAPFEVRAAYLAGQDGIPLVEAGKRIKEFDAKQAAFIHQVYGREITDPLGYDLTINTGELTLETAKRIVLGALESKLDAAAEREPPPTS